MDLISYIQHHKILNIGTTTNVQYICVETIVDCPKDFIDIVFNNDCYISEIRWWHRTLIIEGSNIGYGGPRDPRDANNYFFAETDFFEKFDETSSARNCYEYIELIKKKYWEYDLYPAFNVMSKQS